MRTLPIELLRGLLGGKFVKTNPSTKAGEEGDGEVSNGIADQVLFYDETGVTSDDNFVYDPITKTLIVQKLIIRNLISSGFGIIFQQLDNDNLTQRNILIGGDVSDDRNYMFPDRDIEVAGVDDIRLLKLLTPNTLDALKDVVGTDLPDGHLRVVAGKLWLFIKGDTTSVGNDDDIVDPDDHVGRYHSINLSSTLRAKLVADDTPSDARKAKIRRGVDASKGSAATYNGEFYISTDINGGTKYWSDGTNWYPTGAGVNATGGGALIVNRTEANLKVFEAIYTGVTITVSDPTCKSIFYVLVNGVGCPASSYVATSNTVTFNEGVINLDSDVTIIYNWEAVKVTVNTTDATVTTLTTINMPTNNKYVQVQIKLVGHTANMAEVYSCSMIATAKRNNAGTVSLVGAVTKIYEVEDSSGTPTSTIDVSGTDIRVRVTGEAAKTYSWYIEELSLKTN